MTGRCSIASCFFSFFYFLALLRKQKENKSDPTKKKRVDFNSKDNRSSPDDIHGQ